MLNILIKRNLAKNVCNILHISFRRHCELPAIVMNNGNEMPIIGFGTGSITNDYMAMEKLENIDAQNISENITKAVGLAIDAGYRHIDSSYLYQNEHEIGKVLKKKISNNVVTRKSLFITSKLWNTFHDPDNVCLACQQTLQDLDLDYLDMYIMQSPMGFQQSEELFPMCNGNLLYSDDDYIDTWNAMEDLVKLKLCKNIGISNFNIKQIKRLLKNCQIVPQTLQIEMHPYMTQKKLVNYAKSHDICITAYAPMGFPQKPLAKADGETTLLKDYKILQLAEKHKRTPAQILLRYQIQLGHAVIEKSTDRKQITENINIFDFELCPDDVTNIDSLNHNLRYFKLSRAYGHPYHPFETSHEIKKCKLQND